MNKKLIVIGIILILKCICFSGCNKIDNTFQNTREVTVTLLSTDEIDYFISDFDVIYQPYEGYKYFLIELKVKNIGTEQTHVNINYVTISDTVGMTWTPTVDTYAMVEYFSHADVQPNNYYEGKILFEIYNNSNVDNLYYNDLYNEIIKPINKRDLN